jgi:GMP synthase-like glutamine amidotransferase
MRILVLQHEWNDGPGYLGEALERHGGSIDVVRLDRAEAMPDMAPYDMLLIMGGEMNVYQEDQHPWLADETHLIRRAVEADKAVLGVCLGGQLLAKALGARVHISGAHEMGLVPLALTDEGQADPFFAQLPAPAAVEWHDDTFDIPTGAVRLASSAACANQAFRYGWRAYGLQFHPEVSPEMLTTWFAGFTKQPPDAAPFRSAVDANEVILRDQADRLIANFLAATGLA